MEWIPDNHLTVQCDLGEGPLWHPVKKRLYWVDILAGKIYWFTPRNGEYAFHHIGYPVGCIGFCTNDDLVLATSRGFERWRTASGVVLNLVHPEADRPEARFNDGRVDSAGRFWAGTMTPTGMNNSLYRLDLDGSVERMEDQLGISNGIGWSPDNQHMYFTDSAVGVIYVYDFDENNGTISNREVLVPPSEDDGVPDGLAIDQEGCIWSARWDGWKIIRYNPSGEPIDEVRLPVQRPTSCAFGGADLSTLFITSASTELSVQERKEQPFAGDLFWVETTTKGSGEHFFGG